MQTRNRRPNNIQKTSLQSYMKSKFYLFLGLPNRALNNPAQGLRFLAGLNLYIISIVSNLSIGGNVSIGSVSNVSIVCNIKKKDQMSKPPF